MQRSIIKNIRLGKAGWDTQGLSNLIESTYKKGVRPDEHKTKKSFSPSTIGYGHGNCPRYWYFAFRGAEFQETTDALGVANMANGSAAHDRIQQLFEDADILVSKELEIKLTDPPVRGYADVLVRFEDEVLVGEIKTARQESFIFRQQSMKPSANHLIQILIYMRATGKQNGFVMYENKNTQEFLIIPVKMNDKNSALLDEVLDWMRQVYKASQEENLAARSLTPRNKICKACPVRNTCDKNPSVTDTAIPLLEVNN